jgi:hypothetical protein
MVERGQISDYYWLDPQTFPSKFESLLNVHRLSDAEVNSWLGPIGQDVGMSVP